MSEIKRYDLNDYDELYEQKHGELCYYEDVKALEARIKELEGDVKDYLRVSEKTGYTMREVANRTILDNLLTDTKEPDNQDDS